MVFFSPSYLAPYFSFFFIRYDYTTKYIILPYCSFEVSERQSKYPVMFSSLSLSFFSLFKRGHHHVFLNQKAVENLVTLFFQRGGRLSNIFDMF